MKCCNYSKLDLIRKGLLVEGGGNETVEFFAAEIEAILEDENIDLYTEDDLVVDGPEPDDDAGEEDNPPSAAPETPSESTKRHKLELTSGEITAGRARILRIINQRTPPDIPTAVRACLDEGMKLAELETITGLGYYTLAKCRSGTVTATVKKRFDELFAFPRFHEQEQENEEEE